MFNKKAGEKSKYESPILVPLGEMAKGSGVCVTGSSVTPLACQTGNGDIGSGTACTSGGNDSTGQVTGCSGGSADTGLVITACHVPGSSDCTAGANATRDCTAGPTANNNCSAGTCATPACTAGTAAQLACTAGTANVGHL